jgi:hypothetical protein
MSRDPRRPLRHPPSSKMESVLPVKLPGEALPKFPSLSLARPQLQAILSGDGFSKADAASLSETDVQLISRWVVEVNGAILVSVVDKDI